MQITEQMRTRGKENFAALLADRVPFIAGRCRYEGIEGKLNELGAIVRAARRLGITKADIPTDESTREEYLADVLMLKNLCLEEELFDLLMTTLKEIGVEDEYLDQIRSPSE